MKPVLLDTHVWVWLMNGSQRLGPAARKTVENAIATDAVLVSAITPWEIAMLTGKGRLVLDRDVGEWIHEALTKPGLHLTPLTPEIAVASTRMPGELHGDPADRIIAATARHHGAFLLTDDSLLLEYGKAGHINAIKAGT